MPQAVQLQSSLFADMTVVMTVCRLSVAVGIWISKSCSSVISVYLICNGVKHFSTFAAEQLRKGVLYRAYCFPSITPLKDMETVVQGISLTSPSFQAAIHAAVRTLIDQLGVMTFNVGISGILVAGSALPSSSKGVAGPASASGKVTARQVQADVILHERLGGSACDHVML